MKHDNGEATSIPRWLWRKQRALHAANRIFTRVYHHVDVLTPCNLPRRGPAILVCNHTSGLDPQLIQSTCPRLITWMMAREYYDLPVIRGILDTVGVIPITRGARDTGATRAAIRALGSGEILGIFPEGTIAPARELLPFQTGVALLAMKSQAPVHPAWLDGTQRGLEMLAAFMRPQRARLAFGPPLHFLRSHGAIETVTEQIRNAVAGLQQLHKGQ
jgi:1-acyl-sn-glycerol-3-phosphate acyltransferase